MEKECANCLFEYTCSWAAAGEKKCCGEWKSENREGRAYEEDKAVRNA